MFLVVLAHVIVITIVSAVLAILAFNEEGRQYLLTALALTVVGVFVWAIIYVADFYYSAYR